MLKLWLSITVKYLLNMKKHFLVLSSKITFGFSWSTCGEVDLTNFLVVSKTLMLEPEYTQHSLLLQTYAPFSPVLIKRVQALSN